MLRQDDAEVSVTEVAFACGFGNLGHFANDYFRRFGERPSESVRKARLSR
jgi:transcriptional regulator GlxA family with amidase domain